MNELVKGTTLGVSTSEKGVFKIEVPNKDVILVFSFVGMETQTIPFTGQLRINVAMKESADEMENVVVTGYANVRKESFTGNTTRISREQIVEVSPKHMIDAIQVFDPSFRIAENISMGSDPNSLPEFYIRGQNKPLITPVIFTSGQKITLRKQGIVHELEEDLIDIE